VEDGGEGALRAGDAAIENRGNDIGVAIITLGAPIPICHSGSSCPEDHRGLLPITVRFSGYDVHSVKEPSYPRTLGYPR
jgi:hypothetical protein